MKNLCKKICIVLWVGALLVLGMFYVIAAPKEATYSEAENRNLAGLPDLSFKSLIKGDYGNDIETYLLDRFPMRDTIIGVSNKVQGTLSLATHEEYLLVAEDSVDPLTAEEFTDNMENLLAQLEETSVEEEGTNVTGAEEVAKADGAEVLQEVVEEETKEDPPIEPKPEASIEDYPETLGVYMEMNGETYAKAYYKRDNVLAVTMVLNHYSQLLPKDGKLMFTVVPQSVQANQFVNAAAKTAYYSEWDDVVNGLGNDNVYAFDSAEILTNAILEDEYVYFRTDMHWTPYGSYLVYKKMVERAGLQACDYEQDFIHSLETPFRGTYYRDNPSVYTNVTPDDLDILTPKCSLEWRRITGKDEYKLIDFINLNAKKNDRYTVYLGGPAGPWTYAECDNDKEENCLVLMDSFGLGYLPFLTLNYKQIHYYDPRYFDKSVVGYSVAEMIKEYNIQDIYVIVGDLHSFDSGFLINQANEHLGQ